MNPWPDIGALFTAFFAGLLGSGHCFGMCGGIAAGLGAIAAPDGSTTAADPRRRPRLVSAVLFNAGRVLSYALLGLITAWLLARAGQTLAIPHWTRVLRLLTSAMIFAIGLQFLSNIQLLVFIEKGGASLWRRVMPLALRAANRPGPWGRLTLGALWGLLPCGLVYSILATAAASGSPVSGALVMLSFGLGTLPSMLGLSLLSPTLGAFLADRWTKRLTGLAMILLAIYSVFMMAPK